MTYLVMHVLLVALVVLSFIAAASCQIAQNLEEAAYTKSGHLYCLR